MKYADIKHCDVANGTGVRTSLFVSGCTHRCRGCFNEIAWDFNYGKEFTDEAVQEILDSCGKSYISGLSLLGGEPIWCYTGYTYETDLLAPEGRAHCEVTPEFLACIDILVDGEFDQECYDLKLKFRGSSNQRVLQIHEPGCPELFAVKDESTQ